MKKLMLLYMVCHHYIAASSQFDFNPTIGGGRFDARDINGHTLIKQYDGDIAGSPFLNENWEKAMLTLSKGKTTGPVMVKLNIERNELNFMDSTNKEFVADEDQVRRIDYLSFYTKDSIRYIFKNGYPGIYKQTKSFYYQVFSEGKIELLGKKIKYIRTDKNEYTGETTKEFLEAATEYYVYSKNTMQVLYPYKSLILTIMRDKEEFISTYMNENKLNLKKVSDLIKLFQYYNSL
jgi:hypothetical protein